nr:MAG TPA: hypothetical protein [Caudoviricetes sp.]
MKLYATVASRSGFLFLEPPFLCPIQAFSLRI